MRLHVALAHAGVGSRRACEKLVEAGDVTVNGRLVTTLGTKVEPGDDIRVRGRRVAQPQGLRHVLLHKPRGVVTTSADPEGRPTVHDLLVGVRERLYPVGRLDLQSEGLLLLTNDGELTHALTHPSREIPRTYRAKVHGELDEGDVARLARGLTLEGRRTAPIEARTVTSTGNASWVEVTVREGRKHLVRDALAAVGHPVAKLRRVAFGPLHLGRLARGAFRDLTAQEVKSLRAAVARAGSSSPGGRRPVPPSPASPAPRRPRAARPARKALPVAVPRKGGAPPATGRSTPSRPGPARTGPERPPAGRGRRDQSHR